MKEFVPSWQRKILFGVVLLLPPIMFIYFGGLILIRRPSDYVGGLFLIIVGVMALLFWYNLLYERIIITTDLVIRKNLIGTIELPLRDIWSAKLGFVGRGNTVLIVDVKNRKYRMGMAFPNKTINEMAELICNHQQARSIPINVPADMPENIPDKWLVIKNDSVCT